MKKSDMQPLFDASKVNKFFDIMERLDRHCATYYRGWDKNNPDSEPCQKEVFIKRTISKMHKLCFKLIYEMDSGFTCDRKPITFPMLRYVSIGMPRFYHGYSDQIEISFGDATNAKLHFKNFHRNEVLNLIGEIINVVEYMSIVDMFKVEED